MMKKIIFTLTAVLFTASGSAGNDWPFWRGPEQTGMTREKAVVTKWSLDGENLLWKVPIGGRTTPVLMEGRLYAIVPVGSGECLQERVVCLDADTGKTIWEYHFNAFHTDIVASRLGWTSIAGDPETGNIYVHGTGGELFCFDRDGKILWKRSLTEEFGRYSGYGGRLHTPIIDEDRVIISYVYILAQWGTDRRKSGHRYMALNKHTGEVEWWSQPGGRPHDTTYSVPVVTVVDGRRMLIAANADGSVYGMLARTGEKVWSFGLSRRGLNSSVVVGGKYAYICHSEENLEGTVMGACVCIDASLRGDITRSGEVWRIDDLPVGYASPAIANNRLYVVTNSANLVTIHARTGERIWEYSLGRVMRGSPVVTADGVIYVGAVNGRFLILRDAGSTAELLDETEFGLRGDAVVEINGSPIVSDGRVYFLTTFDLYCLGKKDVTVDPVSIPAMAKEAGPDPEKPGALHVVPMDVSLQPGKSVTFMTRLFDVNGRRIASPEAQWSVRGAQGTISADGTFAAAGSNASSAGIITARAKDGTAEARVRITPRIPINETFESYPADSSLADWGWIGLDGTTRIVERDGTKVLKKLAESPSAPFCRMHAFSGPPVPATYTVEADLIAEAREGRIPILSDMGLINGRYKLIVLGFEKQLRLVAYDPIPRIQKDVPFEWEPDVWYRAKLRVELKGDQAWVRGKVWPRDKNEPEEWTVEFTDPCPSREGSPGLYAYSKGTTARRHGSPVYFDNYRVYFND